MKRIADLFFEARMLKETPRSGYQFLGAGRESVAEHVYFTVFVGWVMTQLEPEVNALKLIAMCLVHDLPEARIGDLNAVNKAYVRPDESRAVADMARGLPFGERLVTLVEEYNAGESMEARLARDADQISLILELKELKDVGYHPPQDWLPHVLKRLQTQTGRALAEAVLSTRRDTWWWNTASSQEDSC